MKKYRMLIAYLVISLIVPLGKSFSQSEINDPKVLVNAIGNGDVMQVKQLLQSGADPNVRHLDYTPLIAAVGATKKIVGQSTSTYRTSRGRMIDGRYVEEEVIDESSIVHDETTAEGDVSIEMIQLLLNAGADVNFKNGPQGATALHLAAATDKRKVVKVLLEAGINIDAQLVNGETALILASSRGFSAVVQDLIDSGADIDKRTTQGYSALMYAAMNGFIAVARTLTMAGVDVSVKNNDGLTALSLALNEGHETIVALLEDL